MRSTRDPSEGKGYVAIARFFAGPRDGKGLGAKSDFDPHAKCWGLQEGRGYVAIWPKRRPLLILVLELNVGDPRDGRGCVSISDFFRVGYVAILPRFGAILILIPMLSTGDPQNGKCYEAIPQFFFFFRCWAP